MRRRGRHRDDDGARPPRPHRLDGRPHRRPGRETVVHEHDGLSAQLERRPVAAVGELPPGQLRPLPLRHADDDLLVQPQLAHDLLVEDADAAARDCPHRQLRLPREPELADEKDVERRPQRAGDLARHRHTAARQAEHDHVVAGLPARRDARRGADPPRPGLETASRSPYPPNHVLLRSWSARIGTAAGRSTSHHCHDDPVGILADELADLPPGRALDLGCGAGRSAVWLAERGWDVTGVDFSDVALGLARKQRPDVDWVLADLREYEPERGAFDLVLVLFVHLPPDERRALLSRAADALAPGGTAARARSRRGEPRHGRTRPVPPGGALHPGRTPRASSPASRP